MTWRRSMIPIANTTAIAAAVAHTVSQLMVMLAEFVLDVLADGDAGGQQRAGHGQRAHQLRPSVGSFGTGTGSVASSSPATASVRLAASPGARALWAGGSRGQVRRGPPGRRGPCRADPVAPPAPPVPILAIDRATLTSSISWKAARPAITPKPRSKDTKRRPSATAVITAEPADGVGRERATLVRARACPTLTTERWIRRKFPRPSAKPTHNPTPTSRRVEHHAHDQAEHAHDECADDRPPRDRCHVGKAELLEHRLPTGPAGHEAVTGAR